jgi:hypothetical protein
MTTTKVEEDKSMDKRPARSRANVRQRTGIGYDEVSALLRRIEQHGAAIQRHRKAIAEHTTTLHDWLACSDEFANAWRKFIAAGGTTGRDFNLFVDGRFQSRSVEQHQHLRLIADNTIKRRRITKKPPDAA